MAKVTGCLPQSVYKDSVKNKTIKSVIRFMMKLSAEYHGCFTGDCPHDKHEECVDALHKQFIDSNVTNGAERSDRAD